MGGKTLAPDWLVMAGGGQWQPLRKRGGQQPHLDWLRAAASARAGSLRRLRSLGTPKRYPPNTPRGPHPKPLRAPPKHPLDTHPNTSSAPLNTPRTSPNPSRAPSGPPRPLKPSPPLNLSVSQTIPRTLSNPPVAPPTPPKAPGLPPKRLQDHYNPLPGFPRTLPGPPKSPSPPRQPLRDPQTSSAPLPKPLQTPQGTLDCPTNASRPPQPSPTPSGPPPNTPGAPSDPLQPSPRPPPSPQGSPNLTALPGSVTNMAAPPWEKPLYCHQARPLPCLEALRLVGRGEKGRGLCLERGARAPRQGAWPPRRGGAHAGSDQSGGRGAWVHVARGW